MSQHRLFSKPRSTISYVAPGRIASRELVAAAAVTFLLLLAVWFDLSPLLRGPAPYPPEWQWPLRSDAPARSLGAIALCAAALLALIAATGLRAARRHPGRAAALILTAATLFGTALQYALLGAAGGSSAADLLVERTISPDFTSHYSVAVHPIAHDVHSFLAQYPDLLPHFPLHSATHPPGAVLFYRAVLAVCESAPALARGIVSLAARAGVELSRFPSPLQPPLAATALLVPALIMLLAAATCWPIAALARRLGQSSAGALRIAVLWCFVPGAVLMVPELDQLLALPIALTAVFFLTALSTSRRGRSFLLAAAAGVVAGIASFISYGTIAFSAIAWCLMAVFASPRIPRLVPLFAAAGACAAAVHLLPAIVGYEPIRAMSVALGLHNEYFTHNRSYAIWLLFNPWDFAVFLGFPLAVLATIAAISAVRRLVREPRALASGLLRLQIATPAALAALTLAGTVRGEAGRILIPLMPFFLLSATVRPSGTTRARGLPASEETPGSERFTEAPRPFPTGGAIAIGLLLLACSWILRMKWSLP